MSPFFFLITRKLQQKLNDESGKEKEKCKILPQKWDYDSHLHELFAEF